MRVPIETPNVTLRLTEDGIIHALVREGAEETEASARHHADLMFALAGGLRRPILVDLRKMRSMDRGARIVYSGPQGARYAIALALLVDSPLSRIIGNFFLSLNRSRLYPTRLFTSESDALAWLFGFLPATAAADAGSP